MLSDKNFTSFDQQIEILRKRSLLFGNEETAKHLLKRFGYYNIINGYKDPYINHADENGEEEYKTGVMFEQIFSLYCMDRNIRSSVMEAMLEVEDTLRTAVAHTIAESFSAEEALYLKKENYRTGKSRKGKFQRDYILDKFNYILKDDYEPIKHHREKYNNVPPWVLLKRASFGNLVNFTKLLKSKEKNNVAALIYGIDISIVNSMPAIIDLFMDTLFVCLDYRNIVAHGGRVYNFIPKAKFRYSEILHKNNGISEEDYRKGNNASLPELLKALNLIDNKHPAGIIEESIHSWFIAHCENYPKDSLFLKKYLF